MISGRMPSVSTSSPSGGKRWLDIGSWPRTRREPGGPPDDRALPPGIRCRGTPGPRVRDVHAWDRPLVARESYPYRAVGPADRDGRSGRRPHLRADTRGRGVRLGSGPGVGAAIAPRLLLAPAARPKGMDGGRDPVPCDRRRRDTSRDRASRLGPSGHRRADRTRQAWWWLGDAAAAL